MKLPKKLNIDKATAWRIAVDVCTVITTVVMLFAFVIVTALIIKYG